ncbi:MAG: redoxin domain-containing protein, partial [Candidatus Obscuribacterales bacterium]|nr:redoxin domain-containing protein [Steroidobacteraceae bacterium]
MHSLIRSLVCFAAVITAAPALALKPGDRVDNFRLMDHKGASHQLHYFSDMKAVVLLTQSNSCSAGADSIAQLKQVRDQYQTQGVQFFLVNSTLGESRDAIAKAAITHGIDLP